MKIFFDTNVYVAEALRGNGARRILGATVNGRWRIYANGYVIDELKRVLVDRLGFSAEVAALARTKITRRSRWVVVRSRAQVPQDPKDSPILQAALTCGADYLVTNDRHLLSIRPVEGIRIVSMDEYYEILRANGLLD